MSPVPCQNLGSPTAPRHEWGFSARRHFPATFSFPCTCLKQESAHSPPWHRGSPQPEVSVPASQLRHTFLRKPWQRFLEQRDTFQESKLGFLLVLGGFFFLSELAGKAGREQGLIHTPAQQRYLPQRGGWRWRGFWGRCQQSRTRTQVCTASSRSLPSSW